ncbi:hypothetical protein BpHYR1_005061 [Brachionus plicatilis]|uniref:Uncharacterized protein n=1 Tax=Brachionus plicatilis TaxID=10195 RepID=A0A3M7T6H0_BRAPC|nr:hypothetical protein BpHYR1_005061 [Brachionus plicatilis]
MTSLLYIKIESKVSHYYKQYLQKPVYLIPSKIHSFLSFSGIIMYEIMITFSTSQIMQKTCILQMEKEKKFHNQKFISEQPWNKFPNHNFQKQATSQCHVKKPQLLNQVSPGIYATFAFEKFKINLLNYRMHCEFWYKKQKQKY